MQDSVLDFLGSALVPVLGTDVAAGTAGNIHLALVVIATLGTYPFQLTIPVLDLDLTIETADLAVVGLGVQLRIDDVVVNELHQLQNCINVLLHVGHFHIGNCTAGRQML